MAAAVECEETKTLYPFGKLLLTIGNDILHLFFNFQCPEYDIILMVNINKERMKWK